MEAQRFNLIEVKVGNAIQYRLFDTVAHGYVYIGFNRDAMARKMADIVKGKEHV
jgi:hypothetical protein